MEGQIDVMWKLERMGTLMTMGEEEKSQMSFVGWGERE